MGRWRKWNERIAITDGSYLGLGMPRGQAGGRVGGRMGARYLG